MALKRPDQLPAAPTLAGTELVTVETLRTVTDAVTNSTATVTSVTATFTSTDVGHLVSGTRIPTPAYVGIVNSATSIGLSSSPTANVPVNAASSGTGGTLMLAALRQIPSAQVVTADDVVIPLTGGAQFLDASMFGVYVGTITQATLFGLAGATAGKVARIRMRLIWDGLGPWTIGFIGGAFVPAQWAAGVQPVFLTNAGAFANLEFQSSDGGTTWQAIVLAQSTPPVVLPVQTIPISGASQVLDFANDAYNATLTANTVFSFTGLQPGATVRLVLRQDAAGGHTPAFPSTVTWFGAGKPTGPLQAAATIIDFEVDTDGATVLANRQDSSAQPPDPPVILGGAATSTTLPISFGPPRISGGSPVTGYTYAVFPAAGGYPVYYDPTVGPTATTATATGLTASTAYVQALIAVNALGNSTIATRNIATLSSGVVTAPSAPQSLTATAQDSSAAVAFAASATGTPDHYTVVTTGAGGASATPLQSVLLNDGGSAVSALSTQPGVSGKEFASNVTVGSRIIIWIVDSDYAGTRTVTINGAVATHITGATADNTDAHVECWTHVVAAGETKPTIAYTRTGGTAGTCSMSIYEYPNVGVPDAVVVGTQEFTSTTIPIGATPTLGAPVELAIACFAFNSGPNTPTYTNSFASLNNNGRSSTASKVTSTTAAVSTTATVGSQDGIGLLVTFKTSGTFTRTDTITPPQVLSEVISPLVNGQTYTIVVTPYNAGGAGTTATTTVTPVAPTGGGGAGGVAAVQGGIGQQQQLASYIASRTSAWNACPPVGTIPWGTWKTNTCVETDLDTYLAQFSHTTDPTCVYRFGNSISGSGQWTVAEVNAGTHDSEIDAQGVKLQTLTVSQGKAQIVRPFYEGADGNWMGYGAVPIGATINPSVDMTAWCTAVNRIVTRVKTKCASIKFTMCFNLGCGDGASNANNHGHGVWDNVMAKFVSLGLFVDWVDWDSYSNGPPSVTWLRAELAMLLASAQRWGAAQGGKGCQIGHGEWGIGDVGGTIPASGGLHAIPADTWGTEWVNWWTSLPANTGSNPLTASPSTANTATPGSFGRVELFDQSVYLGTLPDGRGVLSVPDPTSSPDGKKVGTALKTGLA